MPLDDARRWNERYSQDARYATFTQPRPFLIDQAHWLPSTGLALDVAMGLGGNAAFMLERGLRVIGVDISSVAVARAKISQPALMAVIADLDRFYLPVCRFDVILNFYYLQPDLWHHYEDALRPEGILIFETLTREMLSLQPDRDPAFLLAPGALRDGFPHLEVLAYREGWDESREGHPQAVASLVARKS